MARVAAAAPFEVSAAMPEAMKVGRRSIVDVRFRAASDIYESVEFVLRNGADELVRRPCCPGRPMDFMHSVSLDVTPKNCGAAKVALDVVCRSGLECVEEVHTAELQIGVDDCTSASFSPVINVTQTQTSDRAGVANGGGVNLNFGGLEIAPREDVSRYATPAAFTPLGTTLRKSPGRLTLSGSSRVIQLVSDEVVSFGRNRGNTITLRVCDRNGFVDRVANQNNISRFHFRVAKSGGECLVIDGGRSPDPADGEDVRPSAYGTRVDGEALPPAGAVRLDPGRDVTLGVGREDVELKMSLKFFRDGWGRPAGVLVGRSDGAKQTVCIVWREVGLPSGEKVLWNGSSWSVASRSCAPVQLAVGSIVEIGGEAFTVLPFNQTFVN